jgi:hypothetical protein
MHERKKMSNVNTVWYCDVYKNKRWISRQMERFRSAVKYRAKIIQKMLSSHREPKRWSVLVLYIFQFIYFSVIAF